MPRNFPGNTSLERPWNHFPLPCPGTTSLETRITEGYKGFGQWNARHVYAQVVRRSRRSPEKKDTRPSSSVQLVEILRPHHLVMGQGGGGTSTSSSSKTHFGECLGLLWEAKINQSSRQSVRSKSLNLESHALAFPVPLLFLTCTSMNESALAGSPLAWLALPSLLGSEPGEGWGSCPEAAGAPEGLLSTAARAWARSSGS
jgi:hypothetical protein